MLWAWSSPRTLLSSLRPMTATVPCKRLCILSPSQSGSAKNTSFCGSMSRIGRTATPPSIAESTSARCVASVTPDQPMHRAGKPTWRLRMASPAATPRLPPHLVTSCSNRRSAASPCFRSPFCASTRMPSWTTLSKVASPCVQLAAFVSRSSLFRWWMDTSCRRLKRSYGGSSSCTASWNHCWRHFCATWTSPSPWCWTTSRTATWRDSTLSPRTKSTSLLWPTRAFSWRSLTSIAGLTSTSASGLPCSSTWSTWAEMSWRAYSTSLTTMGQTRRLLSHGSSN